jgi:hypothetical protein
MRVVDEVRLARGVRTPAVGHRDGVVDDNRRLPGDDRLPSSEECVVLRVLTPLGFEFDATDHVGERELQTLSLGEGGLKVRLRRVTVLRSPRGVRQRDFAVDARGDFGLECIERRVGIRIGLAQRVAPCKAGVIRLEVREHFPEVAAAVPVREDVVVPEPDTFADRLLLHEADALHAPARVTFTAPPGRRH